MNKKLNKAIMDRSRLRNKFLKNNTDVNKVAYNKQRNYVVSLLRKSKRKYYNSFDTKKIVDNKTFWKTIKPLFSDKVKSNNKITLILSEEDVVSETMNQLFSNIIGNLNIPQYKDPTTNISEISYPVIKSVEKFKNHPSIQAINRNGP